MLRKIWIPVLVLAMSVALATGAVLNSSIRVAAGEDRDGNLTAVNGSVTLDDGATVRGSCQSVNGNVTTGMDVRVENLSSVNGSVRVGEGTVVRDGVASVNGEVSMSRNARATEVGTVNGRIRLTGAEVTRDVTTVNGDIFLGDGARVGGDIVVEEPHGRRHRHYDREEVLTIEIEGGSVVEGDIIVEDPDLRVEVYLSGGGRVNGRIENARVFKD